MKFAKAFLPLVVVCGSVAVLFFFLSARRSGTQSAPFPAAGDKGAVGKADVAAPPKVTDQTKLFAVSHARLDAIEAKAAEVSEILSAVNEVESDWENRKIDAEKYLERRNEIIGRYLNN